MKNFKVYSSYGRLTYLLEDNENGKKVLALEKFLNSEIDLVFGTHNIHKIPEYLYEAYMTNGRVLEVYSFEGEIVEGVPQSRNHKTRAWVDIMYGCDEFCTYCIVPYTRGRERSS